jgi:hypothetical protein
MAKASLLDKIKANIPQNGRTKRWESRVAAEHQKTLEVIRAAWLAGEFGSQIHPAAAAVAKALRDEGITSVGQEGVRRWLKGE